MWGLMIIGGGILTTLGSFSVPAEDLHPFALSVIKAIIAVLLVILWIVVLSRMKRMIFNRV